MDSALVVIAIGLIIFGAHLFAALFDRARVPDVLPLVCVGLLLGPVSHLISPQSLGQVGNVFTTVALVIILFECGLDLNLSALKNSFVLASKLAIVYFSAAVAATYVIANFLLHVPPIQSLMLGSIVGATSPPVVIPIISKLKLTELTRTTLIVESTICEVLGIVTSLALIRIAQQQHVALTVLVGRVVSSFVLAAIIGISAALVWAHLLKLIRRIENSIFASPAFVCIVFGVAELFGYSGPVAALAFGIVLGNISRLREILPKGLTPPDLSGLTTSETRFFSAMVFLLKTFFFVLVGLSMKFNSPLIVATAGIITLWGFIARLLATKQVIKDSTPVFDFAMISIMAPKGLAAAVLANLVLNSNIEYSYAIKELTFGVILFSITATSIMTFLLERGWLTSFYRRLHQPDSAAQAAADSIGYEPGASIGAVGRNLAAALSAESNERVASQAVTLSLEGSDRVVSQAKD